MNVTGKKSFMRQSTLRYVPFDQPGQTIQCRMLVSMNLRNIKTDNIASDEQIYSLVWSCNFRLYSIDVFIFHDVYHLQKSFQRHVWST